MAEAYGARADGERAPGAFAPPVTSAQRHDAAPARDAILERDQAKEPVIRG